MILKYVVREHFQAATFVIMLNIIVLKLFKKITETLVYFGTMLNMIVLKPRNMLFIKIIVFHKILKTLLYD